MKMLFAAAEFHGLKLNEGEKLFIKDAKRVDPHDLIKSETPNISFDAWVDGEKKGVVVCTNYGKHIKSLAKQNSYLNIFKKEEPEEVTVRVGIYIPRELVNQLDLQSIKMQTLPPGTFYVAVKIYTNPDSALLTTQARYLAQYEKKFFVGYNIGEQALITHIAGGTVQRAIEVINGSWLKLTTWAITSGARQKRCNIMSFLIYALFARFEPLYDRGIAYTELAPDNILWDTDNNNTTVRIILNNWFPGRVNPYCSQNMYDGQTVVSVQSQMKEIWASMFSMLNKILNPTGSTAPNDDLYESYDMYDPDDAAKQRFIKESVQCELRLLWEARRLWKEIWPEENSCQK
jgi:hypothetical protein